jgi:hypothetical protein
MNAPSTVSNPALPISSLLFSEEDPSFSEPKNLLKYISSRIDDCFLEAQTREDVLSGTRLRIKELMIELKCEAERAKILYETQQKFAEIQANKEVFFPPFETTYAKKIDWKFNHPAIDANTTIIPIDIHLAFEWKQTVEIALERLTRQYAERFNTIILINAHRVPLGLITKEELKKHPSNTQLSDIAVHYAGPFGTLETPSEQIQTLMQNLHVNLFPIVDSQTRVLIGHITHETITLKETRAYLPRLQAEVGEQNLKNEITSSHPLSMA